LIQLPTANYVGVFGTMEADDSIPAPIGDGTFLENRATRFRDFGRGLSQTIVVGERTMAQVPSTWLGVSLLGEDAAARIVGSTLEGINNPLADECDFSSRHPGGANFLWADGHVSFVNEDVDLREYHRWARLREISSF
jgi:prepilin-type processing-associated H-X9-DG protein